MIAHKQKSNPEIKETIREHMERTAYVCSMKGQKCQMKNIMKVCGELHDLGKCSRTFQAYILADEAVQKRMKGRVSHASAGAKYIFEKYRSSSCQSERLLAELIAYAIAAHHGLFDMVTESHEDLFEQKLKNVEGYEEILASAREEYLDEKNIETDFRAALEEFGTIQKKMTSRICMISSIQNNPDNKEQYLFMLGAMQRLMLSILIDADWESTAGFMNSENNMNNERIDKCKIFEQTKENFEAYMNKKRTDAEKREQEVSEKERNVMAVRAELQKQCRSFGRREAGIYRLTIPTGGGKTLSSLAYALEFCIFHPETERIFYIAPYTSIIEQNADVFRQIVGREDWILEHHSAVIRTEGKESGEEWEERMTSMDVNWEETFICTTFVQFMNALFSDQKQAIRRMHRLVNAVIIIDEVQSMPIKCIHTFNYMMNFLQCICNTTIVLCTATQPTLERADCPIVYHKPEEMIDNVESWFAKMNRVEVQLPKPGEKYTISKLAEEVVEQEDSFSSILVVLNTKMAARQLCKELEDRGRAAEYITTNLCAAHRSDKIAEWKERLERKERVVAISTCLIEAGIDISFACVYRSMTGLDRVAQSAGRCNRNGNLEKGVVRLIELEGENVGNMKDQISSMTATRGVLRKGRVKAEDVLNPKSMNYFYEELFRQGEVRDKMNFPIKELDTNLLRLLSRGFGTERQSHLLNQAYRTVGEAYRVIDEQSFGVLVPYKEGKELIDCIRGSKEYREIKSCLRKAQRYTVNVRGSQIDKFKGMIEEINDCFPNIYTLATDKSYDEKYGLTDEWDTWIL